ncbi:MAG TPA: permease [Treponema sp.]|nr:permease [Treponema sp.]
MDTIFLYIITGVLLAISFIKDAKKTKKALIKGLRAIEGLLPQLVTVVIIIAVMLAIFDSQTISRYLGDDSGVFGVLAAGIIGAITLIPGFVAFQLAGELLHNGAGVLQIATFVSSLMMVGFITLPLEISYFGKRVAFARNIFAFIFSFGAAFFVSWVVGL